MDDSVCVGQSATFMASSPCCRASGMEVDGLVPDSRLLWGLVATGVSPVPPAQQRSSGPLCVGAIGAAIVLSCSHACGDLLRSWANQYDWSGGQPDPARGNSHYVSGRCVDRLAHRA